MFTITSDIERSMYRTGATTFINYFKMDSEDLYAIRVMNSYRRCLDNLNENYHKGFVSPHCYCIMYDIFDTIVHQFFKKDRKYHYFAMINIW